MRDREVEGGKGRRREGRREGESRESSREEGEGRVWQGGKEGEEWWL